MVYPFLIGVFCGALGVGLVFSIVLAVIECNKVERAGTHIIKTINER